MMRLTLTYFHSSPANFVADVGALSPIWLNGRLAVWLAGCSCRSGCCKPISKKLLVAQEGCLSLATSSEAHTTHRRAKSPVTQRCREETTKTSVGLPACIARLHYSCACLSSGLTQSFVTLRHLVISFLIAVRRTRVMMTFLIRVECTSWPA